MLNKLGDDHFEIYIYVCVYIYVCMCIYIYVKSLRSTP